MAKTKVHYMTLIGSD